VHSLRRNGKCQYLTFLNAIRNYSQLTTNHVGCLLSQRPSFRRFGRGEIFATFVGCGIFWPRIFIGPRIMEPLRSHLPPTATTTPPGRCARAPYPHPPANAKPTRRGTQPGSLYTSRAYPCTMSASSRLFIFRFFFDSRRDSFHAGSPINGALLLPCRLLIYTTLSSLASRRLNGHTYLLRPSSSLCLSSYPNTSPSRCHSGLSGVSSPSYIR